MRNVVGRGTPKRREYLPWLVLGGGILTLGVATYLYLKSRGEVEDAASAIQEADPTISYEEAIAQAAALIAEQAVIAAQQAEALAEVEAQVQVVQEAEAAAAAAQAAAILAAEDEALRIAAEEATAAAAAARAQLEAQWKEALAIAETELIRAEDAADRALESYNTQSAYLARYDAAIVYEHIRYGGTRMFLGGTSSHPRLTDTLIGNDRISSLRVREGFAITLYADTYYGGPTATFTHDSDDIGHKPPGGWADRASSLRMSDEGARNKLGRIRAETISATVSARLVAERALTIAADVRLLGLLLTTAYRLDQIARATITKLASIEARLA